ncbi:hypothetical protein [Streptomyces sp. NPDC012825]|uniref:hypothetical protein n=1 Tax=Streptomyces sp. NPDC012825 TaxID=3364851 RepID=UPI0036A64863
MTKHPASRCRNFGGHSTLREAPDADTLAALRQDAIGATKAFVAAAARHFA